MFTMSFTLSGPTAEKLSTIVKLPADGGKAAYSALPEDQWLVTQLTLQNTGSNAASFISIPKDGSAANAVTQGGPTILSSNGSFSIDNQRERPLDLDRIWLRCATSGGTTITMFCIPR